jgi:hypothetical protein
MSLAPRARIVKDVAGEVAKNLAMMLRPLRAWRLRRPRTAGELKEISDELMEELVFVPLRRVTEHIPCESLQGASIIEVGPGDNIVLGMALLALGAREYHAIDRFLGDVEGQRAQRLYARAARALPERLNVPAGAVPGAGSFPADFLGKRVFLNRRGIEEYRDLPLAGKADLVFSHGVGQFVASPEDFARATMYFLRPGGASVHLVQFGPVGCWTEYPNPLTFLTVPESVWKWTSSHRGSANRVRFHEFLSHFVEAGLRVETEVLEEFTTKELDEALPFIAERFARAPRESLRVRLAKFVCRKPEVVT